MKQPAKTQENGAKSSSNTLWKMAFLYALYQGIKYYFRRKDKKQSHREKMIEAKYVHDLQMEKLKYIEEMKNNKAVPEEQEDEKHEWNDLSDVVNDPAACQQIEYFPGTPVHKGDLCCIYSPTGQGKSTLVMQMLIAMASGENAGIVNDNQPNYNPHIVYLYDSESTREDFQVRYGKGNLDLSNIRIMQASNFYNIERLIKNIESTIAKENHDCVVAIDNMTDMFPRLSEEQVRLFKNSLSRIQKDASDRGLTVSLIVVLHSVKNSNGKGIQEMAGSVNWNRLFKTVISISPSDIGDDYKILKVEKDRSASKRNNIILRRIENPYLHFEYYSEECKTAPFQDVEVKMPEFIDNIPTKVIEEMYRLKNTKDTAEKNMSYRKIIKCYGSQYGLKHPTQVERLFSKYLKNKSSLKLKKEEKYEDGKSLQSSMV